MIDNNEVYIVPVNYGYKDGIIYIHSAPNGRKMDILKSNNKVTFEIEYFCSVVTDNEACKWTARYRSLMGKGTVAIITDSNAKKTGMNIIMRKYGYKGDLSYNEGSFSRMVILKLKIEAITGKQSGVWE
jgi:nitroimidazol reductase NimA-like FMN-containing flavoprotein (pyridoxamine 5'-phosphate oxidase superfamily)